MAGVALGVGVDAHLHVPVGDDVRPGQQRVELWRRRGARRGEQAGEDPARRPVDGDLVAGLELLGSDRHPVTVDGDVSGADDGGDAPTVGDDGGVAHHAAPCGEDAVRHLHAEHIVRCRLRPHEDHAHSGVGSRDRLVRGQDDPPAGCPWRCRQPLAQRLDVVGRSQAFVEELRQLVRLDGVQCGGDREPVAGGGRVTYGGRDPRPEFPLHRPRN